MKRRTAKKQATREIRAVHKHNVRVRGHHEYWIFMGTLALEVQAGRAVVLSWTPVDHMTCCCRCPEPATFDSPRMYCDEHWARWWGGFDPDETVQGPPNEAMYVEALRTCQES